MHFKSLNSLSLLQKSESPFPYIEIAPISKRVEITLAKKYCSMDINDCEEKQYCCG